MNFKKIKIILFIPLALFFIANFFYCPLPVKADASMPNLQMPDLQIKIPGLHFTKPICAKDSNGKIISCEVPWIGEYIAGVYKYAIGIVGILAAVVLMVGGVLWIIAGGNATAIGEAKAWIAASLTGLIIALCSYTILYQINPNLLVFKPLTIGEVQKIEKAEGEKEEEISKKLTLRTKTEYIIIHTTGGSKATVESVKKYHRDTLGWADIGYNFMIERNATWKTERGENYVGAHAKNHNYNSIGISYSGCDNDTSNQTKENAIKNGTITKSQYERLLSQTRMLLKKYSIPKEKVLGHNELPGVSKSCPCIDMDEFRKNL